MKIDIDIDQKKMEPVTALVLHRMINCIGSQDGNELVTVHDINNGTLGAPRVIDPERLASFLTLAGLRGKGSAFWVPERLLAIGASSIAWFVPAAVREMYFKNNNLNDLNGKRLPNPALVFVASDHSLSVFALAENKRPDAKTPLYHAPFLNVYDHGNICLPYDRRNTVAADFTKIYQMEHLFFDSFGSHWNGDVYSSGGNDLWLKIAADGATEFKFEWLKPCNQLLEAVIK